jgi:hypothetical protein
MIIKSCDSVYAYRRFIGVCYVYLHAVYDATCSFVTYLQRTNVPDWLKGPTSILFEGYRRLLAGAWNWPITIIQCPSKTSEAILPPSPQICLHDIGLTKLRTETMLRFSILSSHHCTWNCSLSAPLTNLAYPSPHNHHHLFSILAVTLTKSWQVKAQKFEALCREFGVECRTRPWSPLRVLIVQQLTSEV